MIFASLLNPGVWFNALIAGYFLLACVFACTYFFVKRVALLLFLMDGCRLSVGHGPMVARLGLLCSNHAVNTDAHRRRFAPWWSPVTLVR